MIKIMPDFYTLFSCRAGDCSDNCCIGWEIDIDGETLEKYKSANGDIKKRLLKNISLDETPKFILDENERCPFLNGDNLCDLITECGEGFLCDICREHPRFYEWYGDYKDIGLGLCCEEACGLLFSSDKPLEFIKSSDETEEKNYIDNASAKRIFEIRERLFEKLNDADGSLIGAIDDCRAYIESLQKSYACKKAVGTDEIEKALTEIIRLSEPFDKNWSEYAAGFSFRLIENRSDISENDMRRLFSYIVFRHFVKAAYDNDYITHFKLCILLFDLFVIYLKTNKNIGKEEAVRYISKQFEYSDSNTELLEFECADNRLLSFESLISLTEFIL